MYKNDKNVDLPITSSLKPGGRLYVMSCSFNTMDLMIEAPEPTSNTIPNSPEDLSDYTVYPT